jgi:hypothetical protein
MFCGVGRKGIVGAAFNAPIQRVEIPIAAKISVFIFIEREPPYSFGCTRVIGFTISPSRHSLFFVHGGKVTALLLLPGSPDTQ